MPDLNDKKRNKRDNKRDNKKDDDKKYLKDNIMTDNDMQQDKRRIYMKRKICRFCSDKSLNINYKNFDLLRRFTTGGGKIIPRRMSGNCAKHQRLLTSEIKIARYMAILPFVKK